MATSLPVLAFILASALLPAYGADHTAELVNRVATSERVAAGLRDELEQSRAQMAQRIRDAKAGLESALQLKQAELDRQRTETYAARQIAGTQAGAIDALKEQVAALEAKPDAAVKVAEVAKEAVTKAARVANVRHAEYTAALSGDHDLLVRIDTKIQMMDINTEQYRSLISSRLATAETNISSLQSSRVQLIAYAAGAGLVFTFAVGLLWKFLPMIRRRA
jgi:Mg2+ and Co2+ transporter CorA